jgi:RNA polymerase sigma-70 factor, ECF subfamily
VTALDFTAAYAAHWRELVAYCRRFVHTQEDAEDAVADVFLRAWSRRHQWTERGYGVRPWLYQIARTVLVDRARRRSLRPQTVSADTLLREPGAADGGVERVADRELADALLAPLPETQRTALRLRYAEGWSVADTAALMGKSTAGVKKICSRGCESVRREAKRMGVG